MSIKCLERRCREIIEPKLDDTSAIFVPPVALQTNVLDILGACTYTCFVDFEKAFDQIPRKKLWGVLR